MATKNGTDRVNGKLLMKRSESNKLISNYFGFSKDSEKNVADTNNDNSSCAPERLFRRATFIYRVGTKSAAHLTSENSIKYNFYSMVAEGVSNDLQYTKFLKPTHYVNAAL